MNRQTLLLQVSQLIKVQCLIKFQWSYTGHRDFSLPSTTIRGWARHRLKVPRGCSMAPGPAFSTGFLPREPTPCPGGLRQPRAVQAGAGMPQPLAKARRAMSCRGPADTAAGRGEPGSTGSKAPESRGQGQSARGRQEVIQHGCRGALSRKMSFKYAWLCVLVTLKTIHNLEGDAVQCTRAGDSIRFLSLLLSPQEHGTRSNLSFLKSVITECNGNASKRLREQDPCFKS